MQPANLLDSKFLLWNLNSESAAIAADQSPEYSDTDLFKKMENGKLSEFKYKTFLQECVFFLLSLWR